MIKSFKFSNTILRLSLAAVFLWFGIDKFIHPEYWINAWVPIWLLDFMGQINVSKVNFAYLLGVFETVIGISLVSGVFVKFFSFLGSIFLISVIVVIGVNEVTVRDIGLIGGLISLLFWPANGQNIHQVIDIREKKF